MPADSPPGLAGFTDRMKPGSSAREAACAATSANSASPDAPTAAIAAQRASSTMTSATTPNVPLRLSFMISSLRSRVLPPPKPSAMSATPSSCRLPVTRIAAASATIAASDGGRPNQALTAKAMPATSPTTAPATGAAHSASAKFGLAEAEPCRPAGA